MRGCGQTIARKKTIIITRATKRERGGQTQQAEESVQRTKITTQKNRKIDRSRWEATMTYLKGRIQGPNERIRSPRKWTVTKEPMKFMK